MHLFFRIFVFCLCFNLSLTAVAKQDPVNIFAASRDVPKTEITDEDGKKHHLSDFKGEFVVAVFWSRNCGPCIKELADLNTFYKAGLNEGIHLLLISPESEWKSAIEQKQFLKKYGADDIRFYTDKKGQLAADFGIFSSPHTVLINQNAQEIGRIRGRAKWADERVLAYIKKLKNKN